MTRKQLGPERQQWKGIDANERAFGTVRNALVGIILDGVAGVSPGVPGEERRMISPEDADRYIERGQRVLADFESQEMAPGGARGRAQKWMDRTILELRQFVADAEAVRSGKKPQKMTPESYAELRKHLGVGEARRYPQPKLPPRQFVAPRANHVAARGISDDKKQRAFSRLDHFFGSPSNQKKGFPSEDAAASSAATLLAGQLGMKYGSAIEIVKEWYRRDGGVSEAPRGRRTVRDYLAIDTRDRPIAGPFKSYSDARQAAGTGGAVQFVPTGRKTSEAGDDHRERSLDRLYGHTRGRDPYPFPSDRDRGISGMYGPKSGGAGAPTLSRGARRPPERAPGVRRRAKRLVGGKK